LRRIPEEDPVYRKLEEIAKAAERGGALTRQLLAYSRKQVLAPTVVDLNSTLRDVSGMLTRLIGEDVAMVVEPGLDLRRVRIDRGQIEQVLLNLVANSRDAMPDGGQLTLRTSNEDVGEDDPRRRGLMPAGLYVRLAITDTGVGMNEEVLGHLFEPFFTTKEPGKGTGLGLSTVYGIVEQSGGSVTVATEVGHGTTFRIYLPQVEAHAAAASAVRPASVTMPVTPPPPAVVPLRAVTPVQPPPLRPAPVAAAATLDPAIVSETPPARTETILLVEDALRVRAVVREILEMNGYHVLEARHGAEAIEISERHRGPIHLMVTDVVMPHMSGGELAQRLQPVRPDMRVLYMSGYTDDAIVRHGVLGAGMAFLSKPFTPDALALKVREVLDSATPSVASPAAPATVGAAAGSPFSARKT